MIPEEKTVVGGRVGRDDLERAVYLEEGGQIAVYNSSDEELGKASYDDEAFTSIREAIVTASEGDNQDAKAVREALEEEELYVEVEAPSEKIEMEDEGLENYVYVEGVREELSQDAMDHEYDTAVCHRCHDELDVLEADPEQEGLKVRMYNCDGCGYNDHEFVEEGVYEDGPVTIVTDITEEDDLRRSVDIHEGAAYTLIDKDELEETEGRVKIQAGLDHADDLDRVINVDEGAEVSVYSVDGKDQEEIASASFDDIEKTSARDVLLEESRASSLSEEVREYAESMDISRYIMVEVSGRKDSAVGMNTRGLEEVERQTAEDMATIYHKNASIATQVPVEGLLTQLTDRHTVIRDETRETVQRHRNEPNFELRIHDPAGGSTIENEGDESYLKIVEETNIEMGAPDDAVSGVQ